VDKTFLSLNQAEERGFIHRDYIAHCLRWSHVTKFLMQKKRYATARILDIGCGREAPLAKLLHSSKMRPEKYLGIDIGPINDLDFGSYSRHIDLWEQEDFALMDDKFLADYKATVITSFEMLEHIEPLHCLAILRKIRMMLMRTPDCDIFISTPCWNWTDCAGNHVNEISYQALGAIFEREGFVVRGVWGTFASQRDYVHKMPDYQYKMYEKLRAYYDSNFLSCVFAPLYPEDSRNCLWHLQCMISDREQDRSMFPPLLECKEPWSSSNKWEEFKQ